VANAPPAGPGTGTPPASPPAPEPAAASTPDRAATSWTGPADPGPRRRRRPPADWAEDAATGHLDQLDLFRVLTFAAVVAVHDVANGSAGQSTAGNSVEIVLHYTRNAFFFLSGLVLAHAVGDRPLDLARFWSRRFRAIGVPYLVWSGLYTWYAVWRNGAVPAAVVWHRLWTGVLLGQASYHLYFLLVSMQVYLVFPLVQRLRRVGTAHPLPLLGSLAVFDALVLHLTHQPHRPGSATAFAASWAYITVVPYLVWVVAGAVAAWNLPRVQASLWDHRWTVATLSLLGLVAVFAAYTAQRHAGSPPSRAAEVMQPVMLVWGAGAICLQYLGALEWRRRRLVASRATRAVRWASSAAFGVYLVHPIVLDRVFAHGLAGDRGSYLGQPWTAALPRVHLGQPVAGVVAWVATLTVSSLIVAVVRHTPLSLALTGRDRPGHGGRRPDRRRRRR